MRRSRSDQPFSPDAGSIHGTGSLIGGSGVSLDGQSLQLPEYESTDYGDDVSSIATSVYGGRGHSSSLRIVGTADDNYFDDTDLEDDVPFGVPDQNGSKPVVVGAVPAGPPAETEKTGEREEESKRAGAAAAAGGGVCACLPAWLTGAPKWLKGIMVLSLVLLVAAAALLGYGAATSDDNNNNSRNQSQDGFNNAPSVTIAPVAIVTPTSAPVATQTSAPVTVSPVAPTPSPTNAPTSTAPSAMPFVGQTEFPTTEPSTSEPSAEPSTLEPTLEPTSEPTSLSAEPTLGPDTSISFYAIAWRFQGAVLAELEAGLPLLPRDNSEFMVHLGDWNSQSVTNCDEDSYEAVTDLYAPGPPTFFVVGDNEYNDCPDPAVALELWEDYLIGYELTNPVSLPFGVDRQAPVYTENWAFVYKQALFVGINLVGGEFHDAAEWEARHEANLEWIENNYEANQGEIGSIVIFAHAGPTLLTNANFYDELTTFVSDIGLPTIMVNRNLILEEWGRQDNFRGVPGFTIVTAEGALWPPLRVILDGATGEFTLDQEDWLEEELSGGR